MQMKKLVKRIAQLFRRTATGGVRDYHDADYHETNYGEAARQTALREDLTAEIRAREFGNYNIGPL